jgi:hypothetical protein
MSTLHLDCDFSIALLGCLLNMLAIKNKVIAIDFSTLKNRHSSASHLLEEKFAYQNREVIEKRGDRSLDPMDWAELPLGQGESYAILHNFYPL